MKVHYECASCFLRQSREALDLATDDDDLKMQVTEKINKILCQEFRKGAISNQIGTKIHRTIKEETGNPDPYHDLREKSDEIAMQFLPQVEKILEVYLNQIVGVYLVENRNMMKLYLNVQKEK